MWKTFVTIKINPMKTIRILTVVFFIAIFALQIVAQPKTYNTQKLAKLQERLYNKQHDLKV